MRLTLLLLLAALVACGDATSGETDLCGNGVQDGIEACDDGNTVTETRCDYGVASCSRCDAACNLIAVEGDVCGDGHRDPDHEACDDGNTVSETACPYGQATCAVCGAACTLVTATGNVCGDGVVDALYETCDDHNTDACGTCSADCQTVTSEPATGYIAAIPLADFEYGNSVTVDDGSTAVEFMLTGGGIPETVDVDIPPGATASEVAHAIRDAINGQADLRITATDVVGPVIKLVNDRPGTQGNALLAASAPPEFVVSGMSGGQGGDCATSVGCAGDADCASGTCQGGACL